MGFKGLVNLECSDSVSLGGRNKETGKPNPTQVEGYYIGARKVASTKAKTGFTNLYIFQTAKGNLGVWGKTHLDQQMSSVTPGTMTRVTFAGMIETKNNPMYKYRVEIDVDNTIDVDAAVASASDNTSGDYDNVDDYAQDSEVSAYVAEEAPPAKEAPKRAAPPSPAAQERVKQLLNSRPKIN